MYRLIISAEITAHDAEVLIERIDTWVELMGGECVIEYAPAREDTLNPVYFWLMNTRNKILRFIRGLA